MFYVCDLRNDEYGIKDSKDDVVQYYSLEDCCEYIRSGIEIRGFLITSDKDIRFVKSILDSEIYSHIGEVYKSKSGLNCIVLEFYPTFDMNKLDKCKVLFEDGLEEVYSFKSVSNGHFRTKNKCNIGTGHIGEEGIMSCGMGAEVLEWYGCDGRITGSRAINCRIKFYDGCEKDCSYDKFRKGEVSHPYYLRNELNYVGMINIMNNGQEAKIVEYYGGHLSLVKIRFEDGFERECQLQCFKKGEVENPYIRDQRSLPERIVYYFVSQYFECDSSYKPEWLTFPSGRKGELDIWIPNLKVGIEYDGAAFHKTKRDEIKNNLVLGSNECNKLIRLREFRLPDLEVNDKVFIIEATKGIGISQSKGVEELEKMIRKLLSRLGVNTDVTITQDIINNCKLGCDSSAVY